MAGIARHLCPRLRVNTCLFGLAPNRPDEDDNHLIQLAVAGNAGFVMSRKMREVNKGELQFPGLRMLDPLNFMKEIATWPH